MMRNSSIVRGNSSAITNTRETHGQVSRHCLYRVSTMTIKDFAHFIFCVHQNWHSFCSSFSFLIKDKTTDELGQTDQLTYGEE